MLSKEYKMDTVTRAVMQNKKKKHLPVGECFFLSVGCLVSQVSGIVLFMRKPRRHMAAVCHAFVLLDFPRGGLNNYYAMGSV